MIRWARAVVLAGAVMLTLTACGYQGWTRYECQKYENWEKPECTKPQCLALGTCIDDIIGDVSEVTTP